MIANSVGKVEDGAKLVASAGAAMEDIVTQVRRVTVIIGEIAAASKEQSNGIEQVNQAVTSIDQITQQNAALVEEATAAARSLEEQAGNLVRAVAVFNTADATVKGGPLRRHGRPRATARRPCIKVWRKLRPPRPFEMPEGEALFISVRRDCRNGTAAPRRRHAIVRS